MSGSIVKVAHLTSAHPRNDTRIFFKECRSLVAGGYAVSLVVADNQGKEIRDGVSVYDVGRSHGRLLRVLGTTRRVFRMALELDADIYHLHDPELLLAGLALKNRGKKVVFDSHEDVPVQILSKSYLPPLVLKAISRIYSAIEKYVCTRLDGVIAATPLIREKFSAINGMTLDVCNFPLLEEFHPVESWAEKSLEVCYVGGLSRVRGVSEIVSAMALVKSGTKLNLAGAFSEVLLRNDVSCLAGWSNVIEHGELDRKGVGSVCQRSIAGLVTLHPIPNYLDALPIKMFEYMSAAIPVIASDFPLWRKIVEENDCGVCVNPLDVGEIASAIDCMANQPEEARRMGENGRRAVMTRYNWGHEESKLMEFYQRIIAA